MSSNINSRLAAALIIISGVGIPLFLFYIQGMELSDFEASVPAFVTLALYVFLVLATALSATGWSGPRIPSQTTEEKFDRAVQKLLRKLNLENEAVNEYAEEYTRAQRMRQAFYLVLLLSMVVVTCELWLFPTIARFSSHAECIKLWGIPGTTVLIYGAYAFVFFSIFFITLSISWTGYRTIRHRQWPPPSVKVMRRTKILRGRIAVLYGWLLQLPLILVLAMAVWGGIEINQFTQDIQEKKCASTSPP
ncbi:MAG: hypothetical protein AB1717_05060 [Pseudomonadota bacterium]